MSDKEFVQKFDKEEERKNRRNVVSFWIFGLASLPVSYTMLSAAKYIVNVEQSKPQNATIENGLKNRTSGLYLECNPISTGAVLLTNAIAILITKLSFPFLPFWILYKYKVSAFSVLAVCAYVFVAAFKPVWLRLVGVAISGVAAGIAEVSFLGLTTMYSQETVSGWSSGSGAAGVLSSISYAGLTSAGLSPQFVIYLMILLPVTIIFTYACLLSKPEVIDLGVDTISYSIENETTSLNKQLVTETNTNVLSFREKLQIIPSLLKYTIPLLLVYFAEYFMNLGLYEMLYFNNVSISKTKQYTWYQVIYNIGVFLSRSSLPVLRIHKLWLLSLLQISNLVLLLCQVMFRFIPTIWIMFLILLWEGLIGGAAYANMFYRITNEISEEKKEFSVGIAVAADVSGVVIAGIIAIPVHDYICTLNISM